MLRLFSWNCQRVFTRAVKRITGTMVQRGRASFLFVLSFSNNLTHAGEKLSKAVLGLFRHPKSAIPLICHPQEHLELPQTCRYNAPHTVNYHNALRRPISAPTTKTTKLPSIFPLLPVKQIGRWVVPTIVRPVLGHICRCRRCSRRRRRDHGTCGGIGLYRGRLGS